MKGALQHFGLIYPNIPAVISSVEAKGLKCGTEEAQKEALNIIQSEVDKYKKGGEFEGQFPERWLPASIGIIGEGFNEDNKFLNSTLKMVRGKITEFYSNRIEFLFIAEGKNINNSQNLRILSHWHKS